MKNLFISSIFLLLAITRILHAGDVNEPTFTENAADFFSLYPTKVQQCDWVSAWKTILGNRETNEDTYCIAELSPLLFHAVFDGHGGDETANRLQSGLFDIFRDKLEKYISDNNLSYSTVSIGQYMQLLASAIQDVDSEVKAGKPGSTALVALYIFDYVIIANVGDSRAILDRSNGVKCLSKDHNLRNLSEFNRVSGAISLANQKSENAFNLIQYRGLQRISTKSASSVLFTRSVGDRLFDGVVIAKPEFTLFHVEQKRDRFVVLATDGVYDQLESDAVQQTIADTLNVAWAQKKTAQDAASDALKAIMAQCSISCENATALLGLGKWGYVNPKIEFLREIIGREMSVEQYLAAVKEIAAKVNNDTEIKENDISMSLIAYVLVDLIRTSKIHISQLVDHFKNAEEVNAVFSVLSECFKKQYNRKISEQERKQIIEIPLVANQEVFEALLGKEALNTVKK
jgi:serine/threonine protein phosphatase PrpC